MRFKQGVQVVEDELTLDGFSKKTPDDLWNTPDHIDCRGVKVGTAKLMRYRPVFRQWSTRATVAFNDEVVNESEIKKAISDAGLMIGLGDYRPRFGRFEVEFVK